MVQASDYQVLDNGLYSLPFAEVIYRTVTKVGDFRRGWRQFGDVDNFNLNLNVQSISRFAKNRRLRTKAIEVPTQIDSTLSFKPMQFTDYVRAASMLGKPVAFTQAAGAGEYTEEDILPGDLIFVGEYDISDIVVTAGGNNTPVPAGSWKLVDPALGGVQILEIPGAAAEVVVGGKSHMPVKVAYQKTPITLADARTRISVGEQPSIDLELMARGVSDIGEKGVLHVFHSQIRPANDIPFIGDNDFVGVDLTGSAVLTNRGIATWQKLAA